MNMVIISFNFFWKPVAKAFRVIFTPITKAFRRVFAHKKGEAQTENQQAEELNETTPRDEETGDIEKQADTTSPFVAPPTIAPPPITLTVPPS